MNGKHLTLIEVFGIKIKVNISWVFIAVLLAWALAQGYFPTAYEGLSEATYWWMGVVAVFGLFFSILLHELAHSLVARAFGMEIKGITLWLLGGVAEMTDEPPHPRAEFLMAIAGPLMSVVLALIFLSLANVIEQDTELAAMGAVVSYLGMLNLILAAFNLVPAYPLDGGRVARAALWAWSGDYYYATRVAARLGSLFGLVLIVFGVLSAIGGAGLASLWWVILGMFIRFAADASNFQLQAATALKGKSVREYMTPNPKTVSPDVSVAELVENWIYRYSFEFFPVVEAGNLLGSISLHEVRAIPPGERAGTKVGDIMIPCSDHNTIPSHATASDALAKVQTSSPSLLMVVENQTLVGVIGLKDLMRVITITTELNQK